ncbi:hypothetical protein ACLQ2R_03290 [Streptosporangium sp. DT93]|uniref:hypothetical protein n=1 Tax=Streptosporangium sp. DT93 TaxID=3393428 RepID=UPI003CF990D0
MPDRPTPPAPAPATPCAYGTACGPSTGWRWSAAGWARACDAHRGRRGQFVPDVVNTTPASR